MDTDLSSAERRWQQRTLFHDQPTHRWRWLLLLLVLTTLLALGWLTLQEVGLAPVVEHVDDLLEGAVHG